MTGQSTAPSFETVELRTHTYPILEHTHDDIAYQGIVIAIEQSKIRVNDNGNLQLVFMVNPSEQGTLKREWKYAHTHHHTNTKKRVMTYIYIITLIIYI